MLSGGKRDKHSLIDTLTANTSWILTSYSEMAVIIWKKYNNNTLNLINLKQNNYRNPISCRFYVCRFTDFCGILLHYLQLWTIVFQMGYLTTFFENQLILLVILCKHNGFPSVYCYNWNERKTSPKMCLHSDAGLTSHACKQS